MKAVLPDFFTRSGFAEVAALVALVPIGFKYHFFVADGARLARAGAHVAALQTVVYPAMLVDIQENIAAAAGTTLSFPFRHVITPFSNPPEADE
jgi:hypothetical protein